MSLRPRFFAKRPHEPKAQRFDSEQEAIAHVSDGGTAVRLDAERIGKRKWRWTPSGVTPEGFSGRLT